MAWEHSNIISLYFGSSPPPPLSHTILMFWVLPLLPPFLRMRIQIASEFALHFSFFCVHGIFLFGFMIMW